MKYRFARFTCLASKTLSLVAFAASVALTLPEAYGADEAATSVVRGFNPQEVAQGLAQRGFSNKFSSTVAGLLKDNRERVARGELPNEPEYVVTVEPIKAITDSTGMNVLVNNGNLLPRQDEKQLGLPAVLDESTFAVTLDKLFDGADIDTWLRNADGSEMMSDQKAKYRARLAEDRARYTARLAEFKSAPNGAEIIATFSQLYNEGKKTITYPSRESYRRLLMASLSIASSIHANPEAKERLAPLVMTTVGEYILLTEPNTGTVIKVAIGSLKYFVAPAGSIQGNPALSAITAMNAFQNIADVALAKFNRDNDRILRNGKTAVETAQTEARVAQTEASNELELSIASLSREIRALIQSYKNKKTAVVRSQIEQKIGALRAFQQQLQKYEEDEAATLAKRLAEVTVAYYRNEILSNK